MKRTLAFLSLFTSVSTLLCCALPALFVVLGFGAAFAGLVGTFPQLIWLSENKYWLFGIGALILLGGGLLQLHARQLACPIDPKTGAACATTRDWSQVAYFVSLGIYLIGAFFAFAAPLFFNEENQKYVIHSDQPRPDRACGSFAIGYDAALYRIPISKSIVSFISLLRSGAEFLTPLNFREHE